MGLLDALIPSRKKPQIELVQRDVITGLSLTDLAAQAGAQRSARPGTRELIALFNHSPSLRRTVEKIGDLFADVEFTFWYSPAGRSMRSVKRASPSIRQQTIKDLSYSGELEPVPESNPIYSLFERPNVTDMTAVDLLRVTQIWLDLKNEAFWVIDRSALFGVPEAIWPVPPHWVTRRPNANRWTVQQGSKIRHVADEDMLWIRKINPLDPYGRPMGAGDALADELQTDEEASKYAKAFFQNNAMPAALVGVEGAGQSQIEDAKQRWLAKHRGPGKSHGLHFHSGKITVNQLGHSFKDIQLRELREVSSDIVQQMYGLPPELVGKIENSNLATSREAMAIAATTIVEPRAKAMLPWIQRVADMFDDRIVVGYRNPLPANQDFQLKVMQAFPHLATVREGRDLAGLSDRGEEDEVHVLSTGVKTVSVEDFQEGYEPPSPSPIAPAAPERDDIDPDESVADEQRYFSLPQVRKQLDGFTEDVIAALQPKQLEVEARPEYEEVIAQFGNAAIASVGSDVAFDLLNPFVADQIDKFSGQKITGINETTKALVRAELAKGVAAGEGVNALAKRIDDVFAASTRYRSKLIARTETTEAFGFANEKAYAMTGIVPRKQWITTLDGNARPDHQSLHLQVVGINDHFVAESGERARYPGNFDSAANSVNCRCTIVAVTEDGPPLTELEARDVYAKAIKAMDAAEDKLEGAFRKAFDAQQKVLKERLRALMV